MKRFFQIFGLYLFHAVFVRPVVYFVVGTRYRRRHLAPRGPCIVVANHNSHLDAAVLMTLFPFWRLHRVHPVAAADYFGETMFMRLVAMTLMNAMPIARKPSPGEDPLEPIKQAIARGDSMIFFPEGSRGKAGVVAPFRTGIGRLVTACPGLLVLPVFMSGPERIWARGQAVPVPVNIHANIGRPRTYDPAMDPREIAEQVRNDVLALAPPPPAPPGRKSEPPLRVSICGVVDPLLRREVFTEVTRKLGGLKPTVGLADRLVLRAEGAGMQEAGGGIPLAYGRAWPTFLARLFRTGGWFKGSAFGDMIERTRLSEALGDGRSCRYVVEDGNALLDVLTWAKADYYQGRMDEKEPQHLLRYISGKKRIAPGNWWVFIRKAPEVWLFNLFHLARPPAPDLLILLRQDPDRIMAGLRARGRELSRFENRSFLTELQGTMREVAEALRGRVRMKVVDIALDGREPLDIASAVFEEAMLVQPTREAPEPDPDPDPDPDRRCPTVEVVLVLNEPILVTGGAGFIGASLVTRLLEAGPARVVVLDALTYAGNRSNLASHRNDDRLHFHQADVNDGDALDRILAEHRPTRVIHLAAETHVDRSIDDPEPFIRTNVNGTFSLLQACRRYLRDAGPSGRERFLFLHVSTDEVYGSVEGDAACDESAPFAPNSPYAASKAAADHLVRAFHRTYDFPAIITRSSNNFGPYQFPEKLIPVILLNGLEGRDLPVYGAGEQVRDWLYVDDHCHGLLLAASDGQPGAEYNLGAGNLMTNLELVHRICGVLQCLRPAAENEALRRRGASTYTELIRQVPDRPGHDQRYAVDSGRIEAELGWRCSVTLDQGLERTVAWYLKHRKWCDDAQSRSDRRMRLGTAT